MPHNVNISHGLSYSRAFSRTGLRVSKASQSPVPIGNRPIELHLYSPNASVSILARMYTIFWVKRVLNDLEEEDDGANGANAVYYIRLVDCEDVFYRLDVEECVPVLMAATFLNGLNISMNTIPMLKI